ncbi:4Fe-4S dicluster domain-containing protein [Desulfocurvibacter africanus]|uniref:4Fe-4S ferredoxin iron-sulfur binding domain-containing protein n=2 Tax=Desulfocurvibacter africanus TaxID=873 RepID=F3Z0C3_DESAF|nr:4Fe-4S dicluster domain-containing protein [Desulfocurvibacter africanus]EGJ49825.1 4Fe-4S ferredoxin iron-sulfur binding domain-containing protein [Desulfocurvibacter africanus subsp. africanus str. Walvis Bay]
MNKPQYAMVIDSSRCIDCKGCVASCKVANKVPEGHFRNWVKQSAPVVAVGKGAGQHFQPGACMHCDNPTCVQACPTGATWKDPATGMVEIDRGLCIGCGNCIAACPYGARYRHATLRVADKCDYCAERRAHGLGPACVDTCPTKARVFGDINDPNSEAAILLATNQDRIVRVVNQKSDTKPNMYYIAATAPLDWTVEAKMPTPMKLMADALTPGLRVAVGLAGLGALAMLGRQLLTPASKEHDEDNQDDQGERVTERNAETEA